jgi:hypothetical protein
VLRQANGIVAGISGMRWLRFLAFNALGAALWVGTWVSLGYLAGSHIDTIYPRITKYSFYLLIALAVLLAAYIAWRVLRRRSRAAPTREQAGQPSKRRPSATEAASTEPTASQPTKQRSLPGTHSACPSQLAVRVRSDGEALLPTLVFVACAKDESTSSHSPAADHSPRAPRRPSTRKMPVTSRSTAAATTGNSRMNSQPLFARAATFVAFGWALCREKPGRGAGSRRSCWRCLPVWLPYQRECPDTSPVTWWAVLDLNQ